MNKNEMIEWLHGLRSACEDMELVRANFEDYRKPHHMIVRKLIHEVIGALEDISAEDCVSRQAVLEVIRKCHCEEWVKADIGAPIEALQPITPQPKIGRWINHKCSACGYGVMPWNDTPYCPNCGAKMLASPTGAEEENE